MYLIDGHNLIPKIPGWSLRNMDDEQQLLEALQAYCAAHKRDVEVFFDKAPVGFSGQRRYGRVTAHFVRAGRTADDAIKARLEQLGRAARNATVVSSDRQVQSEARSRQAQVISSEAFSAELQPFIGSNPEVKKGKRKTGKGEPAASTDDLDEWLRLFGEDPDSPPPKNH